MKEILIPTLILFVLALIFSVLLAWLGKKLALKRDEKIDLVLDELAGANCGACGYPGCDGFAVALVKGEANLGSCCVTSAEHKNEIAKLLGVENTGGSVLVVCACRGGKNAKDKYSYQGYGDCRSMELLAGGRKACKWGCLGMGSCVDVCHDHAVEINNQGFSEVDQTKCIKCGRCVVACPKKIMKRIPNTAKIFIACSNHDRGREVREICKNGCIGCGICARNCDYGAITIVDNLAVIDYSKCTACMKCVSLCPSKCILEVHDIKSGLKL